ncbi:MAG TPA: LysR family transcriptional regulator [Candidatus Lachnoclostridium stercorigallinarum]|uniref:LysR family transcriptional regulator n=1 Tax=Candidatus Lachnoclostridium stercorigallinarum TaxID=2838634 RepID=A0A9D2K618_9FIRM|nr:LysR family transcriptional regulator [Candidatus Lachnoclostridium stercorigallinarum]
MELKQLNYIVTIAEEKSLTRAAEKLFVSKPALSLQLSRLEKEEGLPPLFSRTKNGLVLTDAGRIYVNGARTILNLNEKANLAARELTEQKFTLRIAVAPVGETFFLTRVLPVFHRKYPNVKLDMQLRNANDAKELLMHRGLDLALIIDSQAEFSLFHSTLLAEDAVVLAAGEEFQGDPRRAPIILPPPETYWRATCDTLRAKEEIQGDILCETSNHPAICCLLHSLPVTAPMLSRLFIREKGLRQLPLSYRYPYYISMIRPLNRQAPPELLALEELIAAEF